MLVRGARHSELWRLQASIYLQNKSGSGSKGTFSFLLCSCLCLERGITPVRGVTVFGPHSLPSTHVTSTETDGNYSLKISLASCQFILPSLVNCHQVLMTLGSCQTGLIQAQERSAKCIICSLHWPFHKIPAFPHEEAGFNWACPWCFVCSFVNQQYFGAKTGNRLLLLLMLILYQRSKDVNKRKLLNQIRDLIQDNIWDGLCWVLGC